MASAKTVSAIDVRINDVGSILKFRIGLLFWREFCWVLQVRVTVWLPGSMLNFRIIERGVIAATLFADTVSDSQRV